MKFYWITISIIFHTIENRNSNSNEGYESKKLNENLKRRSLY